MFAVRHHDSITGARAGMLQTAHGKVQTPFFMPVATKGSAKAVSPKELADMGTEAIILNAYLLHALVGSELVQQLGGIHRFMNFHNTIFADSGGFQMIRKKLFIGISDKGVRFHNPFTLQKEMITPEDVMQINRRLGSDVAMMLDHMPAATDSYDNVIAATLRTHQWAVRCKQEHDRLKKEGIEEGITTGNTTGNNSCQPPSANQLLFGIAQGGTSKVLREKSAAFINSLGFDGHAIGGLATGESKEEMYAAVNAQLAVFDPAKPRYLMGVGSPADLIKCVAYGIDCFDSVFPTQTARRGTVFTLNGPLDITKGKHKQDPRPIDEACTCETCRHHSKAYLYHVLKAEKITAYRYLSNHNLYFVQSLMGEIRKSISKGYFNELKKEFLRGWQKSSVEKSER